MKRSTLRIDGPSSVNTSNLNFKNNADISKAFDLLYMQVSPTPKPFLGYHSLENVVSKNLQVDGNGLLKKNEASKIHTSLYNSHANLEDVNPSSQKVETVCNLNNASTISIIQSIKERHAKRKKSDKNKTLSNTFSVMKEKRKRRSLLEILVDSVTGTNSARSCSSNDVLKNKKFEKPIKFSKKNTTPQCFPDTGDKLVKIVLSRCENILNKEVKNISETKTKREKPKMSQFKDQENSKINVNTNETTVLTDWIIKPVPGCRGVCVEGQKVDMKDFWHSSAIVEVRKPKVVVTVSGSVYRLKGKINKLCTMDNGFPIEIADAFALGFPKNWRELIQNFFTSLDKSISFHKEEAVVKVKKFPSQWKTSSHANKKENNKDTLEKNTTVMTQHGLIQQEINVSDLVVTRSGRISLPPLARWVGQHYVKNPDSNTIKIGYTTRSAEKFLNHETKQVLQMPKNLQKEIYHKSLSNSLNSPTFQNSDSKENLNQTYPKNKKNDINLKKNIFENVQIKPEKNKKRVNEKDKILTTKKKKSKSPLHQTEKISLNVSTKFFSQDSDCISPEKGNNKQNKKLTSRKKGQSPLHQKGQNSLNVSNNSSLQVRDCSSPEKGKSKQILNKQNRKTTRRKKGKSPLQQKGQNSLNVSNNSSIQELDCTSPEKDKSKQILNKQNRKTTRRKKGKSPLQQKGQNSLNVSNNSSIQELDCTSPEKDKSKQILNKQNKKGKSPLHQKGQNSLNVSNNSSIQELDCTSPEIVNIKQNMQSRKRRLTDNSIEVSVRNKKRKVEKNCPVLDDWSDSEQNKFHRALHSIDSVDPNYWFKVSQYVGSKSEIQCQEFRTKYLENVGKSKCANSKPKKEKTKIDRKKGEPIRGGKGTLKRKKDLRAFLDEQNENYEDDLFNSSPFVKKIPKSLLNCDFDKNVSDIFGLNHNFFTPVAGRSVVGTPSTNTRAVLASVRKGLADAATIMEETPISTKRQKADVLIKKFNGRKKKSLPVQEKKESSIDIELSSLPVKSLFTPVAKPSISVDENDDDGKRLYYWDDDD